MSKLLILILSTKSDFVFFNLDSYNILNFPYSEPKSILGNEKELTREELDAIIKEHGAESRPESRMSQGSRPTSRAAQKQQPNSMDMYQQEHTMEMQEQVTRQEDHMVFEQKKQQQRRLLLKKLQQRRKQLKKLN